MARTARLYVKLDAAFFDDAKILAAGERAAWLYLQLLCKAKSLDCDGRFSPKQVEKLGVPGWKARLKTLIDVGLITTEGDGVNIAKWLDWNDSAAERQEKLEAERKRKAEYAERRAREEANK